MRTAFLKVFTGRDAVLSGPIFLPGDRSLLEKRRLGTRVERVPARTSA
jgi:hypothetical protein